MYVNNYTKLIVALWKMRSREGQHKHRQDKSFAEDTCDKGLLYKIYKELNNKMTDNWIKKWVKTLSHRYTGQKNISKYVLHFLSSDWCKLKQGDTTTYLLEWANPGHWLQMLEKMWRIKNSHSSLVGVQPRWYSQNLEDVVQCFTKLNILVPCDSGIMFLGI